MLLNDDWSVASAAQVTTRDALPVDERIFGVLGISREDVPYVGNMGMQSPTNPAHKVPMVYMERATPGKRFVSHVFPDNRAVDREIFRRHFPQAAKNGVPAGLQPWVLLDREGHVLRSGQEKVVPSEWNRTLETRFPGIKTQGITVTPITDDAGEPVIDGAGKDLQLNSVWLAPGSPPPKTRAPDAARATVSCLSCRISLSPRRETRCRAGIAFLARRLHPPARKPAPAPATRCCPDRRRTARGRHS